LRLDKKQANSGTHRPYDSEQFIRSQRCVYEMRQAKI